MARNNFRFAYLVFFLFDLFCLLVGFCLLWLVDEMIVDELFAVSVVAMSVC